MVKVSTQVAQGITDAPPIRQREIGRDRRHGFVRITLQVFHEVSTRRAEAFKPGGMSASQRE
jgi:hypothetical protein